MFNFKIGGIAAGAAFLLSLIIGIISGAGILIILLRAFIFAAIFFGLACLVYWLVTQFVPELLESSSSDETDLGAPGSRVDISVDTPIVGAFLRDQSESVDDIADKPPEPQKNASPPLDQGEKTGYNDGGSSVDGETLTDPESLNSVAAIDAGTYSEAQKKDELLPDIDGIADASPEVAAETGIDADISDLDEPTRPVSSSKKSALSGDFDPKDLARAVQTLLKKDEKG